jgi:hypothetical protein
LLDFAHLESRTTKVFRFALNFFTVYFMLGVAEIYGRSSLKCEELFFRQSTAPVAFQPVESSNASLMKPVVHKQCFGTCYMESAFHAMQQAMRNRTGSNNLALLRVPIYLNRFVRMAESRALTYESPPESKKQGDFFSHVISGSESSASTFSHREQLWSIDLKSKDTLWFRHLENDFIKALAREIDLTFSRDSFYGDEIATLVEDSNRKFREVVKTIFGEGALTQWEVGGIEWQNLPMSVLAGLVSEKVTGVSPPLEVLYGIIDAAFWRGDMVVYSHFVQSQDVLKKLNPPSLGTDIENYDLDNRRRKAKNLHAVFVDQLVERESEADSLLIVRDTSSTVVPRRSWMGLRAIDRGELIEAAYSLEILDVQSLDLKIIDP